MSGIDKTLAGKLFLLTGGSSGVGKATALGIAQQGAKLVIISRSAKNAEDALQEIAQKTGNDQGEYLLADLSSQVSIQKVAQEFKQKYNNLHVLANLAGGIFFDKKLTEDGIERSFAVNYLSHFLLTHQLMDILKESAPARVITVGGNPSFLKNPTINFDDLQSLNRFNGINATAQAMYARVFFAFELARKLHGTTLTSVAFNPGVIKSNLTAQAPWYMKLIGALYQPFAKEICEVGAYLATSPQVERTTGVFFNEKMQIVPLHERFDPSIGEKLWANSKSLIKV